MSKVVLYVAEGKIEGRFITYLKEKSLIVPGIFNRFNLIQDSLKDTSKIMTYNVSKIFCILDTDCIDDKSLSNLTKNVAKLKKISGNKTHLLIQNKNFEDELKFLLDTSNLGKLFSLTHQTEADVKRHLSDNVDYGKFITKENLLRYCSRSQSFQQMLEGKPDSIIRNSIISIRSCMK